MKANIRSAFTLVELPAVSKLKHSAFTLVELLVVIAIIGTLVGLLLPAVQASRETSRRNQCASNLSQLAKAMQMYEDSMGKYPGYINALGVPNGQVTRAPWVVYMFAFLEQPALWKQWSAGEHDVFEPVSILVCPSNPPSRRDDGNLSYVANGGKWVDEDPNGIVMEIAADGMFFDHSRRADHGNQLGADCPDNFDQDDPEADFPVTTMSLAYIQSRGDGSTGTLMLSESVRTVRYGYRGAPEGQPDEYDKTADAKHHFCFTWVQPKHTIGIQPFSEAPLLRINGKTDSSEYNGVSEMTWTDGFPSSHHPNGVNGAFAAGHVRLLNERIDQVVYCQLLTTNSRSSTLKDPADEEFERDFDQPTEDQY